MKHYGGPNMSVEPNFGQPWFKPSWRGDHVYVPMFEKPQMDANGWKNLFSSLWRYIFQINPMWFEVVHFSLKKKTIFPTHKEATHPSVHLAKARGTWSSSTEEWTTLCSHLSRSVWVVLITHGLHLSTTILHRNADLQNSANTHEYAPNVCSGR